MKSCFKYLMLLAATTMTLSACQKEESVELKKTIKLTVDVAAEDLAADSRTYINNENQILWGTGEEMTIALLDQTPQFVNSTITDSYDGQATATFEFEIEPAEGSTYNYGGVYPASVSKGISNANATAYKIALPATQQATAMSYDPSAYILLAKPVQAIEKQSSLQMSYRRITALNKVTLTGINEDVKSVSITFPASQALAGRRYLDLTAGEKKEVYFGRTSTITVDYETALSGEQKVIWFTSWGALAAAGEQVTIKATSENYIYTRTITANENGISFKEGYLNTLSINMESAEKEELSNLSGTYVIVAKQGDVYYTMSNSEEGGSAKRRVATVSEDFGAFVSKDAYPTNDAAIQWTLAKVTNGYSIANGEKYLSWSSGNSADLAETACAMKVTLNNDGQTYSISIANASSRILAKNATATNGFAFYENSGTNTLYLKPVVADTRSQLAAPVLTINNITDVSFTVTWNSVANTDHYLVTCDGKTVKTSETSYAINGLVGGTDYVVTVVAIPSDYTQHRSAKASTTVTTDASVASGKTYTKITTVSELSDGKYLIVYEAGNIAADGSEVASKTGIGASGTQVDVVINANTISGDATIDGAVFTIASVTIDDKSYYTIQNATDQYVNGATGSNGVVAGDVNSKEHMCAITFNGDGSVKIANYDATTQLVYNTNGKYFRFYKNSTAEGGGTYKSLSLYKLNE